MTANANVFRMTVKELREKYKMIKAVFPLYNSGVWSKDQFEEYCRNILCA